ncbi:putative small integral membrane protein [Pseudomonas sp. TE3786]
MQVRITKLVMVAMVGLFALLVGADNILDYGTNFSYVQHVLAMDTVPPSTLQHWRAISSPLVHHLTYALIIACELAIGVICLLGALRLSWARACRAAQFNAAKRTAIVGLVLGFALWFFGFMVVGGEWFQMWRSPAWNGQQAAFRFACCLGLVLLFVAQRDDDPV